MKHKHHDVIVAWANGAQIEYQSLTYGTWYETGSPGWNDAIEYRIKPEPKPDVVTYNLVSTNYKFIFDGETGKLKSMEIV